jgi:hypothetical protein
LGFGIFAAEERLPFQHRATQQLCHFAEVIRHSATEGVYDGFENHFPRMEQGRMTVPLSEREVVEPRADTIFRE